MSSQWRHARFNIAYPGGPVARMGRVYVGLGMFQAAPGSPKGRRPPTWSLTHLGTGHCVVSIKAPEPLALTIATEIAEAGDWSFDGLQGYKNQFPDAAEKVGAIMRRYVGKVTRTGGKSHEGVAQQIAQARA